jgi:uncharacterized protein YdaU (DUF1376 family)
MNTYDFHIGDYARDTRALTLLEHGIYRLLLDLAYTSEKPLSNDPAHIARKIGARAEREQKTVEIILNEYFQNTPEGWTHKRVQKEMGLAQERTLKAKYSQLCRWWRDHKWPDMPTLADYLKNPTSYHDPITGHIRRPIERDTTVLSRNALLPPSAFRLPPSAPDTPLIPQGGQDTVASSTSDPEPPAETSADTPPSKKRKGRASVSEEAAQIYALYPRKTKPDTAMRAIQKRLDTGIDAQILIQATRSYAAATAKWPREDRQYIPHPSTWFNAGSFMEDPSEWTRLQPAAATQQKKGGGASRFDPAPPRIDVQDGAATIPEPPTRLPEAMAALYGDGWESWAPSWYALTPSDRAKIFNYLATNPRS